MIKVLIVVSGLLLLHPDPGADPNGLTALLLDSSAVSAAPHPIPQHVPAVRMQTAVNSPVSFPITAGNANVVFHLTSNSTINLGAASDFPQLPPLTGGSPKLIAKCLTGDCLNGQKKRVAAVVRFEGGWLTRPLQRCGAGEWRLPVDFGEKATFDFRRTSDLNTPKPGLPARPLATALGLEAQIADLNLLTVTINGVRQDLKQASSDLCQSWLGKDVTSCVILEVENWSYAGIPNECKVADPPPSCRVDEHSAAFYDLTDLDATQWKWKSRWVPYLVGGDLACPSPRPGDQGPGNPPSSRCPPYWVGN